jgi:hypothetical protein
MRRAFLLTALLVAALAAGCPDAAPHADMPEKLKEAGFFSDLDAALAKAKAEDKILFVYLTPSWFT